MCNFILLLYSFIVTPIYGKSRLDFSLRRRLKLQAQTIYSATSEQVPHGMTGSDMASVPIATAYCQLSGV